jgi:23S rRNA pseudouridine1911/1915/1917 synthase
VVEIYRDRWLLVVDKPAGMATQPAPGELDLHTTLMKAHGYVGLHHRLDQPASGLVLFTLDRSVNDAIAKGFREHTIRRTYRAVLDGHAVDATWDRPVEGKPARTDVRVVGRGAGASAVECELHTGRTHQIRVHAALAGRPILGDRRYGGDAGRRWTRLALHAWRLELTHPVTGQPLVATAELPEDLAPLWKQAGGP